MISRADLDERVREWGLAEHVVEKDYALGWVLWGIGSDERLSTSWVFKGGTCLKKCFIETYRFSEDLDFTVLPGGPIAQAELASVLTDVLRRVGDESGINFDIRPPLLKPHSSGRYTEGRIYYQGPRRAREAASIRLDLSSSEQLARPPVLRRIAHPYPAPLPEPGTVRCYAFEEVFAEKIRAMGERGRPRDLYDIINLYWRGDLRSEPALIRSVLIDKCRSKGVAVPTLETLSAASTREELESEWENMLAHQLPELPSFDLFWAELAGLFAWLEERVAREELPGMPLGREELPAEEWSPPATVWSWGLGVPFESVRFAAANRLCVELGYQGSVRLIEPYSLRRTRDGNLLLHAMKFGTSEHRSYRVDRIQSVRVSKQPFTPRYAIEFSAGGGLVAPPSTSRPSAPRVRSPRRAASSPGMRYVLQCSTCGKRFTHQTTDSTLQPHKTRQGWPCSGRYGFVVSTRYGR